MKPLQRQMFFERLRAANPHPTTELKYRNTFQLLCAVILSAQATDKSVNLATAPLFKTIKTPAQLVAFGEPRLREAIASIGLFRTKAKNLMTTARLLVAHYGGIVPSTRAELETLPGVGRKTANVVLNTAFGLPTIAVDTHIFRISNRTGLAPGKTPLEVELKLLKVVPKEFLHDAHHWLILQGRYVCQARKPKCSECMVMELCTYGAKHV
jgi:endonuclease-3